MNSTKTDKKTGVSYVPQKGLIRKIKAGESIITLSGDKIINVSKYSVTIKVVKEQDTTEAKELKLLKTQLGETSDEDKK